MNEKKEWKPGFDLYFEYNGKRMLDEALYFILKNLLEGNLNREFLRSGTIPLYEKKLKVLGDFLGVTVEIENQESLEKVKEIIRAFEREREGIERYLKYGNRPALTVDGIIMMNGKIVLIRRKNEPFKGMHALPGGFVDYGERTEDAIIREVEEETGLKTRIIRLIGVYSDPDRDPRGHTVSVVYALEPIGGELKKGDDAASVELVNVDNLPPLAFDHEKVIEDALKLLGKEKVDEEYHDEGITADSQE